jgi:hypothetical protein
MSASRSVFALLLLGFAAGQMSMGADQDKTEAPKEESVVAYDSKTHGALEVKTLTTSDWFDVFKDGKRAISGNPPRLNSMIELAAGAYVVDVNRTQRKVTIETGKKVILWTGELVVEGKKGD